MSKEQDQKVSDKPIYLIYPKSKEKLLKPEMFEKMDMYLIPKKFKIKKIPSTRKAKKALKKNLKKLNQIKAGLEFINKMREAGVYKCNQETIVGTTEGGLNPYDFLPINW